MEWIRNKKGQVVLINCHMHVLSCGVKIVSQAKNNFRRVLKIIFDKVLRSPDRKTKCTVLSLFGSYVQKKKAQPFLWLFGYAWVIWTIPEVWFTWTLTGRHSSHFNNFRVKIPLAKHFKGTKVSLETSRFVSLSMFLTLFGAHLL